jgi:uncharacterized membrane protein YkoI
MSKIPKDILSRLDNKSSVIDNKFKSNLKAQLFEKEKTVAKNSSGINKVTSYLKNMKLSTALAALAVVFVVGTVSASVGSNRAKLASEKESGIPSDLEGVLSVNDIRDKALAEVPGGTITGVELENEDGKLVYKVKFSDGSIRLFDAKTGELIVKNSGVETDESVPAGFVAQIDISRAREIAQAQRPGKTISKVELETENGVVVYSFRFTDDGRVDVNATDGSVVLVRGAERSDDSGQESDSSSGDDSNDDYKSSSSGSDSDDSIDDSNESSSDDSDEKEEDSSGSNSGSGSDDSIDDDKN